MARGKKVSERKIVSRNEKKKNPIPNKLKSKQSLNKKDLECSNKLKNVLVSEHCVITINKEDNIVSRDDLCSPQMARIDDKSKSIIPVKPYCCSYCDFQTCFYNLLRCHQRRHNIRQPWACSRCSYSSVSKYSLIRHEKLIHDRPKNISCNECDFKCSRKVELKNHMVVHSSKNYFQCSYCYFKNVRKAIVERHSIRHLGNKVQFMCTVCDYRGVKQEYVTRHMKKHHKFELNFENNCAKEVSVKENVDINSSRSTNCHLNKKDHRNIIKKQPIVLLRRCDEDIDRASRSAPNMEQIHEQILQENFFDVAKCENDENIDPDLCFHQEGDSSVVMKSTLLTRNKNIITSIVKIVDNDKSIQPSFQSCNSEHGIKEKILKQLKSKRSDLVHQTECGPIAVNEIIYSDKTNCNSKTTDVYRCKECNFVSTWFDQFEKHLNLHGKNHFSCNKCDFITNFQQSLARHKLLKHIQRKNFECKKCDYRCSSSQYLKCHMRSHGKGNRFKCEKCNISCKTAAILKRHMNKHDEEKPFACDLCDFRTKLKVSLKRHRFIHTGETKYICQICNYKFYKNASLKKHMEGHRLST